MCEIGSDNKAIKQIIIAMKNMDVYIIMDVPDVTMSWKFVYIWMCEPEMFVHTMHEYST